MPETTPNPRSVKRSTAQYWSLIHTERSRIADVAEDLTADQLRTQSLCQAWTGEYVVAHLSAAANTGRFAWLASMARSRFHADRHNARQLARYLGDTPEETVHTFRRLVPSTVAPTKDYGAWLGEVIVHGQDIAVPLGVDLAPSRAAVSEVATYFTTKDFAVNSYSLVQDLKIEALDDDFHVGTGPAVRGNLLPLVMTMAGRPQYLDQLKGDGVAELERRLRG
ncbi:maleylpyruvate isomerase family mycothiol-dependent enzyme [Corynebacterium lubricantis]|uniref:maleylpyruvate isomerase family mycothiol-dependent enzyme n=1 Tax=Corynebacterium lubricantis TaxID=541095 RepID=UPI00035C3F8C|nr:maleylpyruvate isomerase family mycothiol-dependent enzyme [Corynebacterium lubricantis]